MKYLSTKAFILELDQNKKYCFILGAGASISSGIPGGYSLAKQWLNEIKGTKTEEEYSAEIDRRISLVSKMNNVGDYSRFRDYNYEPNLLSSLTDYSQICKLRFEGDRHKEWDFFYKLMNGKIPLFGYWPLANVITKTSNSIVITTNFNELTETAIEYFTDSKPYCVTCRTAKEYAPSSIISDRPRILKLHQDIVTGPYNTEDALKELCPDWKPILESIFLEYIPIVIGYAGTDHTLTQFLRDEAQGEGIYWCSIYGELPNETVTKIVEKRNGSIVEIWDFDHIMLKIAGLLCNDSIYERQIIGEIFGADNYQGYTGYFYWGILRQLRKKKVDKEIKNRYLQVQKEASTTISFWSLFLTLIAGKLRMKGKQRAAIKLYRTAIAFEDSKGRYYGKGKLYYANTLFEIGNLKEAEAVYKELLNPKTIMSDAGVKHIQNEVKYWYIRTLIFEDKISEAKKAVEEQLKKRKCDGLIYRTAAIIEFLNEDYEKAFDYIQQGKICHRQDCNFTEETRDLLAKGIIELVLGESFKAKRDFAYISNSMHDTTSAYLSNKLLEGIDKDMIIGELKTDILQVLRRT